MVRRWQTILLMYGFFLLHVHSYIVEGNVQGIWKQVMSGYHRPISYFKVILVFLAQWRSHIFL